MVLFDAHVHLQKNLVLETLLDTARRSFSAQKRAGGAETYCLLLAETNALDMFAVLKKRSEAGILGEWRLEPTQEPESLRASRRDWPGGRLFIMAGRQIVTVEKIEVLALATPAKPAEGLSLRETVAAVRSQGGIAVLPWGVGKWLGKRGERVHRLVEEATPAGLFLGDNGGRPVIWPAPRIFQTAADRGIRLLPGSDPLPLPGEEARIGGYGASIRGAIGDDRPSADLKRLLADLSRPIIPFGSRMGVLRFVQTQIALRRLAKN